MAPAGAALRTVTSTADDGSSGTLRSQIAAAEAGDTINFEDALNGTIVLTGGQIALDKNLTITGPGAATLTVSGNHSSRIFSISLDTTVIISDLTLANGKAPVETYEADSYSYMAVKGGAILNAGLLNVERCTFTNNTTEHSEDSNGGAIYNWTGVYRQGQNTHLRTASLTLNDCTFTDNVADFSGGAIFNDGGNGTVTLTANNCTFAGNKAHDTAPLRQYGSSSGGAIYNAIVRARTTLTNCTFTANSADGSGGAIVNYDGWKTGDLFATVTLTNCTLDGNTAGEYGGGIYNNGTGGDAAVVNLYSCTVSSNHAGGDAGGGIYIVARGSADTASIRLLNTIGAYNTANVAFNNYYGRANIAKENGHYAGGRIISLGHNVSSDSGGDYPGAPSDYRSTDPKLGPLQNNGGPTLTRALLADSPAIDTGGNNGAPVTDQRGQPRALDGDGNGVAVVDIGAVEMPVGFGPRYSISGRVSDAQGTAIGGVTISRDGESESGPNLTVQTNSAGYYTLTGVPPATYTITVRKTSYTFAPASRSVTITNANAGNQNFIGTTGYSISGRISNSAGVQIAGVSVSRGAGSTPVLTNSAGYYTFIGVQPGTYTLTATKIGVRFTPPTRSVSVTNSNVSGQNFIGATGYNISGRIADRSGIGRAGISLKRSGSNIAVTTNSAGYYTFTDVPNGTVTVTPNASGTSFAPESRVVTVDGVDIGGQNFIASPGFSISGRITTSSGIGINGVTVTRSGSNVVAVTNSAGYFTFTGTANGNYTLTPSLSGYNFTPTTKTATVNSANLGGQNFIGTAP